MRDADPRIQCDCCYKHYPPPGLLLSAKEDIFITKNGKIVAKLTNPHQDRVEVAKSLFGILPKDADLNEAKEERLGAK